MQPAVQPTHSLPTNRIQGRERRASVRYLTTMEASYHPLEVETLGPCAPARIWDISLGGLSLLVDKPFEPGTDLAIVPEILPQHLYPALRGRVVHTTPHGENQWLLGYALFTPLSEEDLQRLLV